MNLRNWLTLGGITAGLVGAGLAANSFLPHKLLDDEAHALLQAGQTIPIQQSGALPTIDVEFLRCGTAILPDAFAVRGAFSLSSRALSHSAVLIRHPRGTFLYDTGLCTDISLFLLDQSPIFKNILARFTLERPLGEHLQRRKLQPRDLDFVLLSHLHWDHVGGIPDLPGVKLRVNRIEYTAASQGLLDAQQGLVRRLLGKNPVELFDLAGPPYAGFRSSYDLFGDGSLMLVPLPGHTAGQTGLLIQRSNGPQLFLIGDAAWFSENYLTPATMHPFLWSMVTSDDQTARQTLFQLHQFAHQHPEIPMIAMHDAHLQETFQQLYPPAILQKQ